MASKNSKKSNKKNNSFFAVACVVLALLILFIIFLVKKDQIFTNFKETAFFDRVFGTTPQFVQNHQTEEKEESPVKDDETITINLKNDNQSKNNKIKAPENKENQTVEIRTPEAKEDNSEIVEKSETKTESKPAATSDNKTAASTEKTAQTVAPVAAPAAKTELSLCFVQIDSDGILVRKISKRSVPKTDSPLVTAINLLIKGPDFSIQSERNLDTCIPKGTKLLGASVKNGVATLNFNEDLTFNPNGAVGLEKSLMQIVYTATAFSTVNSVQFLIEGQKVEYLEDGVYIGSPLGKGSF